MLTPDTLKTYIASGLECEVLDVSGDGHHFEAVIVAKAFEGLRLIQRHQAVYTVLGDRMRVEIHALSMKTLTPTEWAEQSRSLCRIARPEGGVAVFSRQFQAVPPSWSIRSETTRSDGASFIAIGSNRLSPILTTDFCA